MAKNNLENITEEKKFLYNGFHVQNMRDLDDWDDEFEYDDGISPAKYEMDVNSSSDDYYDGDYDYDDGIKPAIHDGSNRKYDPTWNDALDIISY